MTALLTLIAEAIVGKMAPWGASSLIELGVTAGFKLVTLFLSRKTQTMEGNSMNQLFKAIIQELFDLEAAGVLIAEKASVVTLFPVLIKAATDAPAVATNWSDLVPEAKALMDSPAAETDLLTFTTGLWAGNSSKAAKVIGSVGTFVFNAITNGEAVIAAVKS